MARAERQAKPLFCSCWAPESSLSESGAMFRRQLLWSINLCVWHFNGETGWRMVSSRTGELVSRTSTLPLPPHPPRPLAHWPTLRDHMCSQQTLSHTTYDHAHLALVHAASAPACIASAHDRAHFADGPLPDNAGHFHRTSSTSVNPGRGAVLACLSFIRNANTPGRVKSTMVSFA